jgi:BlaI family transcriptional regulator, penicillinase repressor
MPRLSPLEEEIMHIFWNLGKAFPKEIIAYLTEPLPPYNTILSTIRKLEKDGLLTHKKFGKSHQYSPSVQRDQVAKNIFQRLLNQYFKGSKMELLSHFVESENIDERDLQELLLKIKSKKNL